MKWYFAFGLVLVGFIRSGFARNGALATVGFGQSGVLGVLVDLVALYRLNGCRRRLQLRLRRSGATLLLLWWAASAALAVRRLLVGRGWWVWRLLDIGIN